MAGELKVRHQLCAVDWEQLLDRFQFDDQAILDHQVNPQGAIYPDAVINYRQANLALGFEPTLVQFMEHADLIDAFEQARS